MSNDISRIELEVLRHIMRHPGILSQTDKYILSAQDFSTKANRLVFMSLQILQKTGWQGEITPDAMANVAEDNMFFQYLTQVDYFKVIEETLDNDSEDGFDYAYVKLKRHNLLNALDKNGFKIDEFRGGEVDPLDRNNTAEKVDLAVESTSLTDILNSYRTKLNKLEKQYLTTSEISTSDLSDNIDDLIASFGTQEDLGLNIQGTWQNRAIAGARLGTLTIRSAASGAGKTRLAVADAAFLAYPIRYDFKEGWHICGHNEKVLMVVTEQTEREIQRMVLAYLANIQESRFRFNDLTDEEHKRLQVASKIMQHFMGNLTITRMPEPNVELIKTRIREEVRDHGCKYVFFDYIQVSPSLYKEFNGSNLRTDEALLMMTQALKDIAVELNICVFSATQLNSNGDNKGDNNIKNEASLAGARSIINKADNGIIMMRPTNEQMESYEALNVGGSVPNRIFDIFKVRSGDLGQIRVWTNFDMGTMRYEDICITDFRGNIVSDVVEFDKTQVVNELDEVEKFLNEEILNG